MNMNDRVREAVRRAMADKGLTQAEMAKRTGIRQPTVSRVLSGVYGGEAETWQRILDELGLELTVKPKGD